MDSWYDWSAKSSQKSSILENKASFLCHSTSVGKGYSFWWFINIIFIQYCFSRYLFFVSCTMLCSIWYGSLALFCFVHGIIYFRYMFGEVLGMFGDWWSSQSNGKLRLLWSCSRGLNLFLEVFIYYWILLIEYVSSLFHITHLSVIFFSFWFLVNVCTSTAENISVNCNARMYVFDNLVFFSFFPP